MVAISSLVISDSLAQLPKPASRYQIIEFEDGFRIEGQDRHPVEVRLSSNKTSIVILDGDDTTVLGIRLNMYAYPPLLNHIINILMEDWMPPPHITSHWDGAFLWACSRVKEFLHRRIYYQWRRLLEAVPLEKRLVAKAIFAATFDYNHVNCEEWDEIYKNPFLVQDIIKYRAAAIACHYADKLTQYLYSHTCNKNLNAKSYYSSFYHEHLIYDPESRQHALDYLQDDWKILFSTEGKAGRSLCRTLMNLPGGIPAKLLCALPKVEFALRRPITDRLELLALLCCASNISSPANILWAVEIFVKAHRLEILAALRLLSAHLRQELPAKKEGITRLLEYIKDYCRACHQEGIPSHRGNLVGLTEKAIRWHRQVIETEMRRQPIFQYREARAALPPVPPPDDPAIKFLARVEDICQEGMNMQHCIASYAGSAVQGYCYLFHIDYKQSSASVMVEPSGNVTQSYGPRNSVNAASNYGKEVLGKWGKKFPEDAQPVVLEKDLAIRGMRGGWNWGADDVLGDLDAHPF